MADPLATLIGSDHAAFPRRTVFLQHILPDGSFHFDWMIARDAAGESPLMTFRLDRPLNNLSVGECLGITQLPDHRPMYLDYEGPVSRNRGTVARVACGLVRSASRVADRGYETAKLRVNWSASAGMKAPTPFASQVLNLRHIRDDEWTVTALAEESSADPRVKPLENSVIGAGKSCIVC